MGIRRIARAAVVLTAASCWLGTSANALQGFSESEGAEAGAEFRKDEILVRVEAKAARAMARVGSRAIAHCRCRR